MKNFSSLLLFISLAVAAHAFSASSSSFSTQRVNIPAGSYTLNFDISWACDDYPQNSAPGRIELVDSGGNIVGRVVASVYRPGNISVAVSGGTVSNTSYWMAVWATSGAPADGDLTGTWNISGVAPGDYTLRFYSYTTWETALHATTVWTSTYFNGGSVPSTNQAPTISWNTTPSSVASGQGYTISAHGHDADGNLAQVNVWRNGQPYAFAGGGNGTDGDSGNPSSDAGPQTITYTAQAVDAAGLTSSVITQTVTVAAPNNPPAPTISVDGYSPGQSIVLPYGGSTTVTVRYRATDPDGNLSGIRYNVWNSATGYFDSGGGGFVPQSGGSGEVARSVALNASGTWYFWTDAMDATGNYASTGAWSAGFPLQVTIASNAAPTIAWTSAPSTAASGQSYTISAHGHDTNGNLTQVNVWKNGQPFAFAGGGNGYDSDSGNPSSDTGPQTITYTAQAVDAAGAASSVVNHTITISAPPLAQYTLTMNAGTGGTVSNGGTYTAGTVVTVTATPDSQHVFSGWTGDATGSANPISVTMDRDKSVQAVFALKTFTLTTTATTGGTVSSGGNYTIGSNATVTATPVAGYSFVGWGGDASGTANPLTVAMTANKAVQAVFAAATYTLTTSASPGGSVSPGGAFSAGSTATITATPDSTHDFAGWSGDAAGSANPVSLSMNGNKAVQASFSVKMFPLTTSATSGGNVTPGGSYPYGAIVTLTATPDAGSQFTGWTGDASGTAASVAVAMNGPRAVQAVFAPKLAQTVSFPAPTDHAVTDPAFDLNATATSGLPVTYAVVSGPAVVNAGKLQLTGPGAVTVQASQPGNAAYLAAPSVSRTFNAVAPVVLKYRPGARTLLSGASDRGPTSLVIEKP